MICLPDDFSTSDLKEETVTDRAIESLFKFSGDTDDDTKTELSHNQIIDVSKAVAFADTFDLPLLNKFIKSYKHHMISKNRLGRREVIEALKAEVEKEESPAMGDKFKNLFSL